MNTSLISYSQRIEDIENELDDAQRMLDRARDYDGTVNMTTVNELLSQLLMVNSTIAGEYFRANRTISLLLQEQQMISNAWIKLNLLNMTAQELLDNLTIARDDTEEAAILVQRFDETYNLLRGNLSVLAVRYDMLRQRLLLINQTVANASVTVDDAGVSFGTLVTEIDTRIDEANMTLGIAVQLNSTINATQVAAQMTLDSANRLLVSFSIYPLAILC